MQLPTIKEMITVGAHFGHKKDKTHPKAAKKYGFGIKDGIYIIDLDKTQVMLKEALDYLAQCVKKNQTILIVGTKRQAQEIVKTVAVENDVPYINHRWLGGMITNFETVKLGINKLKKMEAMKETDEYKDMTKQEKVKFNKKIEKLQLNLSGIKNLNKIPDVLFIVDVDKEKVAVAEAKNNNIPVVGIADINVNPDLIDYIIPVNDDSRPTIEMIMKLVGETIKEVKKSGK